MKILYVTTIGITMGFFKELIKQLIEEGHTVDIATNESDSKVPELYRELGCKIYQLSCCRSPFRKENLTAVREIKKLVEENHYDIVHCHTPIAAVCTRFACQKVRKSGTRVFYTAHGFHFYKGAPLVNWLVYYPVEWLCAHFTDVLITINKEDYARARKHMHAKRVEYVPGVGIDVEKFANVQVDRAAKRREIGVPEDATVLISVGELSKRKNHEIIIKALSQIENNNIHYLIVGEGSLLQYLQKCVSEQHLEQRVHFLGYRKDVAELYKSSDICCFPSIHEGLPVALMEAMASGLPVVCSKIRGSIDLINEGEGHLCDTLDTDGFAQAISCLVEDKELQLKMGKMSKESVDKYSIETIIKAMNKCMKK